MVAGKDVIDSHIGILIAVMCVREIERVAIEYLCILNIYLHYFAIFGLQYLFSC